MAGDTIEIYNAQIRCKLCGFYATIDGAVTAAENEDMGLEIQRMHSRQRHGELTSFATIMNTYETPAAPVDVDGRPERQN